MRVALLSPFGALSQEAGLVHLLANYGVKLALDVVQLRCNGVFPICDRDGEVSWKRQISSCFECMSSQNELAEWSGVRALSLSSFLQPEEVVESRRWVLELVEEELAAVSFREISLPNLIEGTFRNRFGADRPNLKNRDQVRVWRSLLTSALRMVYAARRFQFSEKPDLSLVTGGRDYISKGFLFAAKEHNRSVAVFSLNFADRCIEVHHSRGGEPFRCELVLDGVTGMRRDRNTWPREIVAIVEGLLNYLGISPAQLNLPIAGEAKR